MRWCLCECDGVLLNELVFELVDARMSWCMSERVDVLLNELVFELVFD